MMARGSTPMDPWQAAHAAYMKDLNPEEQALFATATLDNLLASTDAAQKQHQDESKSRYIFHKLQPLVEAIDQYGRALDVYSNTYSLAMGPIWGSIRVLLHIAKAFEKYFEKIINMLARIGDILPRCQVYQRLFPTNERLLQAISVAYLDIIDFCWSAKNLFRKMKKSTTLHMTFKSLWRDFNKGFDEKLNDFRTHVKIVEKQAGISNMIEASEERALIQFEKKVDRRNWLLSQLSSISCVNKHLNEREKRHKGTGSWLTKTVEFVDWVTRTRSDCLWCYGIPGSGKTVLMSYLVDELSKDAVRKGPLIEPLSSQDIIKRGISGHQTIVIFYFCDSSDPRSLKLGNILGTIIRQLLETIVISEVIEKQIESCFRPHGRVATEEELFTLLLDAVKSFSEIYILIDGLDECDKDDINKILPMLSQLLRSTRPLLKIALFSREENNIANAVKSFPRVRVSSDKISLDLSTFIKETVESKIVCGHLCISEPLLKVEVINALIDGAQGMFLWVYFQLLDLCDASSEFEVRNTLQSLPQGMTATYTKILEKIGANRANMVVARKLFKWIVCAKRPMLLNELTEAVAFEATDTSWNKDKVLDAVRLYQAGGNLVVVDEKDGTVRLAHHTVQQFLLNLPDHQSALVTPFHFRVPDADLEAGEICVAYLSFSDFERQISTLRPDNAMPVISLPLPAAILERTTSELGLNFRKSRLFNFAYYLRTGQYPQEPEKTLNYDFSKFARMKVEPPQKMQEKYFFLNYAIENWVHHTSNFSEDSAVTWKLFKNLATNKPLPFDIRPWGDVDDSNATTYTTLLLWAGNAQHRSLMKLVPHSLIPDDQLLLREALKGQIVLFEFLIRKGFNIDTRINADGQTALIQAAMEGRAALVEFLLAYGAKLGANDDQGRTAWHLAAGRGHTSVVKLLLAKGANINAFDRKRRTAWGLAVERGHTSVIRLLLANGVNIDAIDELNGETALTQATINNEIVLVNLLLDNLANVEAKNRRGRTALHEAAEKGYTDLVGLLLTRQSYVGRQDDNGDTALSWAAIKGHADIVDLLLTKKADMKIKNKNGQTALIWASQSGSADIVELLLIKGADIEAKDNYDRTALIWASKKGHDDVIELLLTKGADVEVKDRNDRTALIWASQSGKKDMSELLLNKGAEMEAKDDNGRTALIWASQSGTADIVEFLLTKGADMEAKDSDDRTAMIWASQCGKKDIVELLLAKGADMEAKDSDGRTALIQAASWGTADIIELLLTNGTDIEAKDSDGRTALYHAVIKGRGKTVELLLNKGANTEGRDLVSRSMLSHAAEKGLGYVIGELLIKGANVESTDKFGRSAMHYAVCNGHADVVELLLKNGASVDYSGLGNPNRRQPLHDAASRGNVKIVKLLLDRGADIWKLDGTGKTALDYAIKYEEKAVIIILRTEQKKSRKGL